MTSRRRQRLPLDAYRVEGSTWHVTISVDRRNGSPFHNIAFGQDIIRSFIHACERDDEAIVHLVCIMPDHLHALIEVRSKGLVEVVGQAKSITTRIWWASGGKGSFWQTSFYDHGIREMRDFEATATYIFDNSVKEKLADEWELYPLFGGALIVDR